MAINIRNEILRKINEQKTLPVPVTEQSDLFLDLGFDSLGFVGLLLDIEQRFLIEFELVEMAACHKVCDLLAVCHLKLGECEL